ncbi:MAG: N-formylglutamate amidohydrolase, partial [Pseudomonadota bacterium]|nr:N-formylglutamate amidohydrolase [Pseudomonadota bacterium]
MTDFASSLADTLPPLLGPDDPPPYEVVNNGGQAPLLLLCDHASNRIPAGLDQLGLEPRHLQLHIAIDIGAAGLTRRLAERLDAVALLAGYSRLVIDLNRQPGHPTSIPEVSDGIIVPGNQRLGDAEADRRLESVFWPYHHAITNTLSHLWRHGPPPALVAMHSFTPVMHGRQRPWHLGVLWNHDPRLATPLLRRWRAVPDLCVGDNEPYSGHLPGDSIDRHALRPG